MQAGMRNALEVGARHRSWRRVLAEVSQGTELETSSASWEAGRFRDEARIAIVGSFVSFIQSDHALGSSVTVIETERRRVRFHEVLLALQPGIRLIGRLQQLAVTPLLTCIGIHKHTLTYSKMLHTFRYLLWHMPQVSPHAQNIVISWYIAL